MLNRSVPVMLVLAMGMFLAAPYFIAQAPYESTMGLVQKIFYFHVPAAIMMFLATFTCGFASVAYLVRGRARSDRLAEAAAELTVLFGIVVLISGPLWARKAWGVWWQWDARLTSTLVLWLLFSAYLLLRRFGGPGTEKLAAGVALFGMANVPFIYWSVNVWRTLHPKTTVVPSLVPAMKFPFYWCMVAFLLLFLALLRTRVRLAEQQDALDLLLADAEG
ncbi:cytochrome C biogenesis protein CcmC [Luteitalea sp. TBR-22]|uniref:cytochrome c biogenesis protein n=1 Tax=Luteitalea sp. TBR-22 TaxID=2802971 RepID=UPI001AF02EF8|nr:cytochrome c biogenesis protein CcsA [Luteitalea sp. TBR-22]BCS33257.1 cytochrome C biogenesis protein CcmC [Luteitalea sp. TBR-22]